MKKPFVVPVLRHENTLSLLTQGGTPCTISNPNC